MVNQVSALPASPTSKAQSKPQNAHNSSSAEANPFANALDAATSETSQQSQSVQQTEQSQAAGQQAAAKTPKTKQGEKPLIAATPSQAEQQQGTDAGAAAATGTANPILPDQIIQAVQSDAKNTASATIDQAKASGQQPLAAIATAGQQTNKPANWTDAQGKQASTEVAGNGNEQAKSNIAGQSTSTAPTQPAASETSQASPAPATKGEQFVAPIDTAQDNTQKPAANPDTPENVASAKAQQQAGQSDSKAPAPATAQATQQSAETQLAAKNSAAPNATQASPAPETAETKEALATQAAQPDTPAAAQSGKTAKDLASQPSAEQTAQLKSAGQQQPTNSAPSKAEMADAAQASPEQDGTASQKAAQSNETGQAAGKEQASASPSTAKAASITQANTDPSLQLTAAANGKSAKPDQVTPATAQTIAAAENIDAPADDASLTTDGKPASANANTTAGQNTLATHANKPAANGTLKALHEASAPKGAAFSRMMAELDGTINLQDMTSQAASSGDTDLFGQSLPDNMVRLSGMESFARTGLVPNSAAAANSQAIAAQISKFVAKGETRFEIRLDPAELGKVDVKMTIGSDGQARAHLFVERSETLDFLMRDQRMLERSLQQSGVNLDDQGLEFSLMDQNTDQQSGQFAQNQEQGDTPSSSLGKMATSTMTEQDITPPPAAANALSLGGDQGVNVII